MADLSGKKVLALVSNRGVEQDEPKSPLKHLRDSGAEVTISAPETGDVLPLVGDWDRGDTFTADMTLEQVSPDDYDLLSLPGGTLNADSLRLDSIARSIAKALPPPGVPWRPFTTVPGSWLRRAWSRTKP